MSTLEHERFLQVLRENRWFGDLSAEILDALAGAGRLWELNDGAVIVRRGSAPPGITIILRGEVRSKAYSPQGSEIIFSILKPGTLWGIVAVLDGLGSVHDTTAHGRTELLVIARPALLELIRQHPALQQRVTQLLCYRLRKAYAAFAELAFIPVRQRLARQLCALAVSDTDEPQHAAHTLALTQSELAVLLGVSRPIVNKTLKQLEREGLLSIQYGQVIIVDYPGLRALCAEPELFAL